MTDEEAQAVLAVLTANWPKHRLPAATASLWFERLEGLGFEEGIAVARRIVLDDEWFPNLGRFNKVLAVVRQERRRATERDAEAQRVKALPSKVDPQVARNTIAEIRRRHFGG